jgi:hypothetical protein
MTREKIKWLLVGLAVTLITAVWVMGQHDYAALVAKKRPTFAWWEAHMGDGGSIQYSGLGYRVTAMHQIVPPFRRTGEETGTLFRIGPELQYWIPVFGRDGTTTKLIPYPRR